MQSDCTEYRVLCIVRSMKNHVKRVRLQIKYQWLQRVSMSCFWFSGRKSWFNKDLKEGEIPFLPVCYPSPAQEPRTLQDVNTSILVDAGHIRDRVEVSARSRVTRDPRLVSYAQYGVPSTSTYYSTGIIHMWIICIQCTPYNVQCTLYTVHCPVKVVEPGQCSKCHVPWK